MFSLKLELQGGDQLTRKLKAMMKKNVSIKIGYSAPYAVLIHEDLTMPHQNGQAQFLSEPIKTLRPSMSKYIRDEFKKEVPFERILIDAAEKILEVSKQLVPVDTGFLRDSGFVELEKIGKYTLQYEE